MFSKTGNCVLCHSRPADSPETRVMVCAPSSPTRKTPGNSVRSRFPGLNDIGKISGPTTRTKTIFEQVSELFRYLSISFYLFRRGNAPHSTPRNQRLGLLHSRPAENPGSGAQQTARNPVVSVASDKGRTPKFVTWENTRFQKRTKLRPLSLAPCDQATNYARCVSV